mmetsp:Transcript_11152/g.22506  ORF Transcript_11152/g.22506 Transcript_11152/m.22506 type:complete len:201 (+) Transcript_11152:451-1053(+)
MQVVTTVQVPVAIVQAVIPMLQMQHLILTAGPLSTRRLSRSALLSCLRCRARGCPRIRPPCRAMIVARFCPTRAPMLIMHMRMLLVAHALAAPVPVHVCNCACACMVCACLMACTYARLVSMRDERWVGPTWVVVQGTKAVVAASGWRGVLVCSVCLLDAHSGVCIRGTCAHRPRAGPQSNVCIGVEEGAGRVLVCNAVC